MQSIGFTYSYLFDKSQLTSRIGVSLKQIRANRFTQLTDDFKTPLIKEKYKAEMGIEFKTEATLQVNSSIRYFTILEFFGKYNNLDKITGKWQNELQVSLWKSLSLILKIDLAYDENQRAKLQYKENLRLEFVNSDVLDWVKKEGRKNTIFMTSNGVFEYFTEQQLREFIEYTNSLGQVLFVTIEPTEIHHNFELNPNSTIYGMEKSFSHNYDKIFQDSGFKIIHHSKKIVHPGGDNEMNYILAGN